MKLNIHLLLCSKRHYIDEIEYPPSPICGEKPQFESNVTSFQFRQNASARWWPLATTSPRRFGGDYSRKIIIFIIIIADIWLELYICC